jgi:hypothetical protein
MAGYFAVLLALAAFAAAGQPRARFICGSVVLLVSVSAALLDFGLRKEAVRLPSLLAWSMRISTLTAASYMIYLAYPVIGFLLFDRFRTDPPTSLAEQGPDTNYARMGMMTIGPRHHDEFGQVYYFWNPSRSNAETQSYLRFDYDSEAALRRAIPESRLKWAGSPDCAPPPGDSSRPPWFIPPGTKVGPTYVWRSPRGLICFDEAGHRAFIRMPR